MTDHRPNRASTTAEIIRAKPGRRVNRNRERVLRVIAEQPGISLAEVSRRLGIRVNGVWAHAVRLVRSGHLRKVGRHPHTRYVPCRDLRLCPLCGSTVHEPNQ